MFANLIEIYQEKKWKIYTGCFFFLLVWALWSALIPRISQTIRSYSEIQNIQTRMKQAENWETTVSKLKAENIKLKSILTEIQVQAPHDDELSYILDFLSTSAEKTKVRFVSIKPQEIEQHAQHRSIPIFMELRSSFHNLTKFLNLLETSKNIIKIERAEIKTKGILSTELLVRMAIEVLYLKRDL
jgi:Tfp pilus assembly protein PilO